MQYKIMLPEARNSWSSPYFDSRTTKDMPGSLTDALSLIDYLSRIFPSHISNKFAKNRKLIKFFKYAILIASALAAINTYVIDLGLMALRSCSFGMVIDDFDLNPALEKWMADKVTLKTSPSLWEASSGNSAKRYNRLFNTTRTQRQASEYEIEANEVSSYWFFHKGSLFRYEIELREQKSGELRRRSMLRNIGFSKKPTLNLLQEAHKYYAENYGNDVTSIWSVGERRFWEPLAKRKARKLDTVDLHEDVKQNLIKDITHYLSQEGEDNYLRRGTPYRRGYLFHGPPGTGKSSLSMALAAHFKMDVSIISLKSSGLNDSSLLQSMAALPPSSLLLLEDIDSAGIERESADEHASSSTFPARVPLIPGMRRHHIPSTPTTSTVTLSGLLNALDGAAAPEGCVLIMTTNDPDALDQALTRPGRVDYKVEFQNADKELARSIFRRVTRGFDEEELEEYADKFASQIPDKMFSPAELHGYLLTRDGDIDKVLQELPKWMGETLAERQRRRKQQEEGEKRMEKKAKMANQELKEDAEDSKAEQGKDKAILKASAPSPGSYVEAASNTAQNGVKANVSAASSLSSSSVSMIELGEVQPLVVSER